ncbi:MAG TPA: PHP domain-containing protein [Candidatus Limiplasma sp.]|nr:PHP domain-containing protein [Candidatus Limiplasma sp.]HPS82279.1 PHP domain-containing protein [Candidatus Limiplasma sp.]
MSFLSNAHTHTTYCDGQSTVAEQLTAAQRLGFVSLGFSGHAMQGFDWQYCMSVEEQSAYRAELRCLQDKLSEWSLPPRVYVGLEQDALVPDDQKAQNRLDFDYLIGSTHYFPDPLGDAWVAVDGSPELLKRYIGARCGGDPLAMARAYFQLHGASVEKDKPDVIGHFDLVRKYAAQIGLDTACPAYRDMALEALAQARRGCRVLEVNTGNIARGYDTVPYPAPFMLNAWRELAGELTLTSDCHNAQQMDCAFEQTLAMLKANGWKRVLRLGTGNALWDEVTL